MLEGDLRAVMADETAALAAPPDLVDRVERVVRRRRARLRLVAAAVTAIVAGGAIPAYVALNRPPVVASRPLSIGLVQVRYVPADMGDPVRTPTAMSTSLGEFHGTALRWQRDDRTVQVTVYDSKPGMYEAMNVLSLNVLRRPVEPRHGYDPVVSGDGTDMMWIPRRDMIVRVTVSPSAKDDLRRVADGLDIPWEPSMAGIMVGYMPPGLRPVDTVPMASEDGLERTWLGRDGAQATIEVVYGVRASSLDALRPASFSKARPVFMGAVPGLAFENTFIWVIEPGLGVRVSVSGLPTEELMKIAGHVDPLSQDIRVTYVPPGLTEQAPSEAVKDGWRVESHTWQAPGQLNAFVSVQTYRGRAVYGDQLSDVWPDLVFGGPSRQASVGGHDGYRASRSERRSGQVRRMNAFAWSPEPGTVVVVSVGTSPDGSTAYPIEPIVEGVRVLRIS